MKVAMRVLGLMVSTEFSALCAFGLRSKPAPRIVELFVAFSAEDVIITKPFLHIMVLQLDVIMVDTMFLDTYGSNVLFLS